MMSSKIVKFEVIDHLAGFTIEKFGTTLYLQLSMLSSL